MVVGWVFVFLAHFLGAEANTITQFSWSFVPLYAFGCGYLSNQAFFMAMLYFDNAEHYILAVGKTIALLSGELNSVLILNWLNPTGQKPEKKCENF